MSIPVQADRDLANISNSADLILLKLRVMRHTGQKKDLPRLRLELRTLLQEYIERCMAFADEVANPQ
jgi:hypothetical protein